MSGMNHFGVVDYIFVGGTLLFSICIGIYYAVFGENTKEAMLVGGRKMKVWPVAISMIVTYYSATTILGFPAEIYAYGLQALVIIPLMFIFTPLSAIIFVEFFYNLKLTSIYQYLELRFNSRLTRWLTSFTFILQIVLLNAITLFAPAIALQAILGMPMWVSITGIGVIGTVYTALGGLRAVVWTDVFQFVMIVIGMGAIVVKGFIVAGGVENTFRIAGERGRLEIFDWSIDFFERQNTFNFFFGNGFAMLTLCGTHQPLVQRYSSLPSPKAAFKTLVSTIPLATFTYLTTMLVGIIAVAIYAGCCPILLGQIFGPDAIIPHFVIAELSFIPGMLGLFISCIFSAVLSSVSSNLNSLAAVTWEDFFALYPYFYKLNSTTQANWTKIIAAVYGVISIFLAFGAQNAGTLFQIVMTAFGATSGPLGGIFLCGLFLPFMNGPGAVVGSLCGLLSMMYVAGQAFFLNKKYVFNPRLPTDLTQCPAGTNMSMATNYTIPPLPDLEYPEKLYTLSYLLYAITGALITLAVGILVSVLTGGLSKSQKVEEKYIHPWIRKARWVKRFLKKSEDATVSEAFLEKPEKEIQNPYNYELSEKSEKNKFNNNIA